MTQELVVFTSPQTCIVRRDYVLTAHGCKAIKDLVEYDPRVVFKYDAPKRDIPLPSEFEDVIASEVLACEYDEVSPFPYANRARIAYRILRGDKIAQWTWLEKGELRPFSAWRGSDGVVVQFINPKEPLKVVPILYCKRACGFSGQPGYQCSAFGSYSQIELSSFLPIWQDQCSAESAKTCPMRKAVIAGTYPKASIDVHHVADAFGLFAGYECGPGAAEEVIKLVALSSLIYEYKSISHQLHHQLMLLAYFLFKLKLKIF